MKSIKFRTCAMLAVAISISGCNSDISEDAAECPASFDFKETATPLGDGRGLFSAARNAALHEDTVTMRDVTRAAGLKDDWDRMVVVFPGTKEPTLNSDTGISSICWKNLPPPYRDDTPHAAYYLFIQERSPLQAIHWFYPNDRELDFMTTRTRIAEPDTTLVPIHAPGVEPHLRPAK